MQENAGQVANAFQRIVKLSSEDLRSEEDVKINVVLPILRALGYDDSDFRYEGRTGRGYVDVVVEHYPTGIVIETKSPGKNRLLAESCGQGVRFCYPQVRRRVAWGIGKGCETPIFSSWPWV